MSFQIRADEYGSIRLSWLTARDVGIHMVDDLDEQTTGRQSTAADNLGSKDDVIAWAYVHPDDLPQPNIKIELEQEEE